MYSYSASYGDEELYWERGRTVGGVAIGVIQRGGSRTPMVPGNMGNGTTFPFTLMWQQMAGNITIDMLVSAQPHPKILEQVIQAGKQLQAQGCRAVMGNCGYLANYQPEVAAALDIPVFLSSLLQVPVILQSIKPERKVGIICASGQVLSRAPALGNCGIEDLSRIIIAGAENTSQMKNVLSSIGHINNAVFEKELVELAKDMVEKHPEVGAILLECSELPPYAWAIQEVTHRPVFDYTTLTKWIYNSVVRDKFAGIV